MQMYTIIFIYNAYSIIALISFFFFYLCRIYLPLNAKHLSISSFFFLQIKAHKEFKRKILTKSTNKVITTNRSIRNTYVFLVCYFVTNFLKAPVVGVQA